MKARIRFDWQSTPHGALGGIDHQNTEYGDEMECEWEDLKAKARAIADRKFKPIHPFDGQFLQGIVLQEISGHNKPYRYCSFPNPFAS